MAKKKIGIVFGGKSGEHEVSIVSAMNIYAGLDKKKYDVTLIGIDKTGRWLLPDQAAILAQSKNPRLIALNTQNASVSVVPFESKQQLVPMAGSGPMPANVSTHFDVIFPVLHGTYGEDGTIQGLLELANIPYVGSGVLGSSIGMDKDVAKRLYAAAGIPVVPFLVAHRHEFKNNAQKIIDQAVKQFGFPFFVKPANMGSSVGVNKVKSADDVMAKFKDAFLYDRKVLIEKAIDARELEVSVLGNFEPKTSIVGEIIPQHEFYSYEAKYMDENGALLDIPAKNISESAVKQIQNYAVTAFRAIECRGMARVDFFMDRKTGELYLNEINTIPGFTNISMYPKMWNASGLSYEKLLDTLIELAIENHQDKNDVKTSYSPES
jgi:D-alanine-D-alanine ligase